MPSTYKKASITTCRLSFFFFFNDTATTEIYTLSLHDALPILPLVQPPRGEVGRDRRPQPWRRRLLECRRVISVGVFVTLLGFPQLRTVVQADAVIRGRRDGVPDPERALEPDLRLVQAAQPGGDVAQVVVHLAAFQQQRPRVARFGERQRLVVAL